MSILAKNLARQNQAPKMSAKAGTHKELVRVKDILICDEWENSDGVEFSDISATAGVLEKGKWSYFTIMAVMESSKLPEDLENVSHFYLGQFYRMVNGVQTFTTIPYNEKENPDFYEADGITPVEALCVETSVQLLSMVMKQEVAAPVQPTRTAPVTQPNITRAAPVRQAQAVKAPVEEFIIEESADEPPF